VDHVAMLNKNIFTLPKLIISSHAEIINF